MAEQDTIPSGDAQITTGSPEQNARQALAQEAITVLCPIGAKCNPPPDYFELSDVLPDVLTETRVADTVNEWIHNYQYENHLEDEWEQQDKEIWRANVSVKPEELVELFDTNKEKLDGDHNGFVTAREINKQLNHFSGKNYSMLRALSLYAGDIQEQSNDELGDEDGGITSGDMKQFASQWNSEEQLELVKRVDYVGSLSLRGHELMNGAFRSYQFDFRESWGRGGSVVGMVGGTVGGAALADVTGGLLAPLIPAGLIAGGYYGKEAGEWLGRYRGELASEDRFMRKYVTRAFERD